MTTKEATAERSHTVHWTVKNNYRLRTSSYLTMFASILVHGWDKGYPPFLWVLIALQLLVYPHLAYQVARRAAQTQNAEVRNLILDSFMFGMLSAALQFPLWISFTVYLASTMNLTFTEGMSGLLKSQLGFYSGVLLIGTATGWPVSLETSWPVTSMCMVATVVYMAAIGLAAYHRHRLLHKTRQALIEREHTLQQHMAEILDLQEKLQEQAVRDPLTGLYNRRFLDTIVRRELARCQREGLHLSVMMIDVDHFKKVNDVYGHPGGDEVLKALAALLAANVRADDVPCRFGGEEFLLMMPGMAPDFALVRAEQCRQAFADARIDFEGKLINATLSVGIAVYPMHGDSLAELTRCADLALYKAKEAGRNQVVLYQPEHEQVASRGT